MDGRGTRSGWQRLLAPQGESESAGKAAVWKSESCHGHPDTVKCQGALKEENITEILTRNWACVLGCQEEKAPSLQEQMVWYPGIVSELRILLMFWDELVLCQKLP